ncbi:MAG: efflux RND transporter periplasmic adaptor subunit [Verrucomicrobia bacterium]|nr:efflux RND transporter periplasmic adaptor subunit [Verrucomicrobiota bacterium]
MTTTQKGRGKTILWVVLILVLLGGGGTGYYFYKKRQPVIAIQTEKVSRRNLTELVVANGRIQPVIQVKISPEVSGEIIALPVKEGQLVKKGDLLLKIKPDFYEASRRSSHASFQASLAAKQTATVNLDKADTEFKRHEELMKRSLISESLFLDVKTSFEVAKAQLQSATHQVEMAKASLEKATEDLAKTTIVSPIDGTISRLNSQLGERVVGTAMMAGTEVMIVADLNEMEARVDIGEIDVVLIALGQKARLEVDAFRDRKFSGLVTEIANSSKGLSGIGSMSSSSSSSQDATKFEVRIRIQEKEIFRPGMTVTAEVETRYRTNVLTVPIQSVTTRLPKKNDKPGTAGAENSKPVPAPTSPDSTRRKDESDKPVEVVFAKEGDVARMIRVKPGISDDNHTEILEGVTEGQEIVSGSHQAISRELEDGKKIKIEVKGSEKPGEPAK